MESEMMDQLIERIERALDPEFASDWDEQSLRGLLSQAANELTVAAADAADAERLQWLLDTRWSVTYRGKSGPGGLFVYEYGMRNDEGDRWGRWWPTQRQAIDEARAVFRNTEGNE
jgi:hypothetical protein